MARTALAYLGGEIVLSSTWKIPCRGLEKYLNSTSQGVEGSLFPGYGEPRKLELGILLSVRCVRLEET